MEELQEQRLSDAERALRDRFVTEYLEDFNVFAAAQRVGYNDEYAKTWGPKLFHEPYVQRRIAEMQKELDIDEKETHRRRIISTLYRESNYFGPGSSHGARVAALSKLSAMFGFDAPVKTSGELTVNSPVQFYIPNNGRE